MRVTSTPDCASSCATTAASLALSEPERSDPGITRIFNADIFLEIALGANPQRECREQYQPLRYTQTRAGGRFIQIRSEASVDTPGSDFGIGGTTRSEERRVGKECRSRWS